jgi:RNA polymerase sigma-54 factor
MSKLQPMILKDVADRIHMDISTISRVASSKYVQTDHGIYSLKEFFSEGITTDDGSEVSNIEVKEKLKEFVLQEDKDKPLTDDELTDMMKDLGYNIARRTIAKYREQLNIPVARLRKVL